MAINTGGRDLLEIDFGTISPQQRYKLLVGFIIPRPIAFVTTVDENDSVNAAPFSFFNVFGEDPALVVLGFDRRSDGSLKDTTRNILETGEFVVNMVDESIATAMNTCAVDFPPGVNELAEAGLTTEASQTVRAPRIAESPACFECRHIQSIQFKAHRTLLMGEVKWLRARDNVYDAGTMRVIDDAYKPVGRLYADLYSRQSDRFALTRQSFEEWQRDREESKEHESG